MPMIQTRALGLCRGQASLEYALACAALAVALGLGVADGGALSELVQGLSLAYRNFSFSISLPE